MRRIHIRLDDHSSPWNAQPRQGLGDVAARARGD
jgi:hypothetical protein